ncbi:N-acetylmuramoyl-L-alanine amidase [Microcoleus sp.]|uniref:N-acetylmuramoyl-L-alanine amidase n=1 Tax=Microcoleus sp. TaxID=44472 RepID=UPI003593F304
MAAVCCLFLFVAAASRAQDAPESASLAATLPVVNAGSIKGDQKAVSLSIEVDRKIEVSTFYMREPDRIVIDAPAVLFRFDNPVTLEPKGLIASVRYGAIARERSRIVLTLAAPAEIAAFRNEEIEKGSKYRLTFELTAVDAEKFRQAALAQREVVGASGEAVTKGDRVRGEERKEGRFLVVIDPGHGGIDGGASGKGGTKEKDLTLAMARRIAKDIAAAGEFDVLLTRDEDVFLSLRERVAFSRRNKADLAISIHADSLRQRDVRGASVYTLSRKASDDLAHELAESENMVDIAAGLEAVEDEDIVTDILADLTARETGVFSKTFSATLVATLGGGIQMIKNPQRSASFAVLRAAEVPGVLLELGYLSNAEDEKSLTDPVWQESVARLVAKAVVTFFAARGG